jgi:ubiquinone/menaquinone biosynthesis C-methylase UbiE
MSKTMTSPGRKKQAPLLEDPHKTEYKLEIAVHFDNIALKYDYWKRKNVVYHEALKALLRSIISPNCSVLDIGTATGDILSELSPSFGVGVDFSTQMLKTAKVKHPRLNFVSADADSLPLRGKFDYIVMADLVEHLVDVRKPIKNCVNLIQGDGKLVILTANPIWSPILWLAELFGQKMPEGRHKFIFLKDISDILAEEGFSVVYCGYRMILPRYIPILSNWLNDFAPKIPLMKSLCLIQFIVAMPRQTDLNV